MRVTLIDHTQDPEYRIGDDVWVPTEKANGFYRLLDTGKRHTDGTMIQQMKCFASVLEKVQIAA